MDNITYRIKIKKGNVEIEVQGDKEWVEDKFKELSDEMKSKKSVDLTQSSRLTDPVKKDLSDSLSDVYRGAGEPRSFSDQVLLLSYWLSKKRDTDSVNVKDMSTIFDEAKLKQPKNMTDTMRKINKDYFIDAADKDDMKAYKLSLEGEKYVEKMLRGK